MKIKDSSHEFPNDICITILDTKTLYNLTKKREIFCRCNNNDSYARRFTLDYYNKYLTLLSNTPFSVRHLNVYMICNAIMMNIVVPKKLHQIKERDYTLIANRIRVCIPLVLIILRNFMD